MGEIGPKSQPNGFGPKKRFNLTPKLAPLGGVFYGKPSKRDFALKWDFLALFGVFGKRGVFDIFWGYTENSVNILVKTHKKVNKKCVKKTGKNH